MLVCDIASKDLICGSLNTERLVWDGPRPQTENPYSVNMTLLRCYY